MLFRSGKAFRTSIYGAIINAVVNLCFVELIGLQAAAVSTFLGFLVMWLVRERQNKEELQIRINWFEFWALTLLAVWMSIASILMDMEFNIILTVTGFCIFVSLNYQNVLQLRKMLIGKINKK